MGQGMECSLIGSYERDFPPGWSISKEGGGVGKIYFSSRAEGEDYTCYGRGALVDKSTSGISSTQPDNSDQSTSPSATTTLAPLSFEKLRTTTSTMIVTSYSLLVEAMSQPPMTTSA